MSHLIAQICEDNFNYWSLLHFSKCWPSICFSGQIFSASCCTIYLGLSKLKIDQNTSRYPCVQCYSLFSKASVICPLRESEINWNIFRPSTEQVKTAQWMLKWCRNTEKRSRHSVKWPLPVPPCCKNWGESSTEKERERRLRPASWPFSSG